jgi:hypothetical protein
MFRKAPTLTKIDTYYQNNRFNFNFSLEGMLSSVNQDISDFGVMLFSSDTLLQNFIPSIDYINNPNTKIVYLTNDKKPIINNNLVKFVQNYTTNYENSNVYLYATTFKYNKSFEQDNKDLSYFFGNTIQFTLKINSQINKSILDYSIIDKLSGLIPEQLYTKDSSGFAISDLYTSFIDINKIKNYLFINHMLMCQKQKDNITKILNNNSSIVNRLLNPNILIKTKDRILNYQTGIIGGQFDYITFEDDYSKNTEYEINLNYDLVSLSGLITELYSTYKKSNSKASEASFLGLLNIAKEDYRNYLIFLTNYNNAKNKQDYNLLSFFDSIMQFCEFTTKNYTLSTTKSNKKKTKDSIIIKRPINVPFDGDKYFDINNFAVEQNKILANIMKVKYKKDTFNVSNKKDLYSILLANSVNSPLARFDSILNNRSVTIAKKQNITKLNSKNLTSSNLIEDYKITNQKVAINDVFSRYPTDKPKVPVPTSEQKQKEQNIIKNITHKLFGTISEYNDAENLNLNYYLQIGTFNSQNLKNIQWTELTLENLQKINNDDLIFIKLIPNFSNLKVSNKIFNFSYNINQLIKAREIKENVA